MIEIKVPDDAWLNWPDEPGDFIAGKPGSVASFGRAVRLPSGEIVLNGPYFRVTKEGGYRFAMIDFPILPKD